ncbi:MAG TPA: peptide chain release factor N(5)-glutamine methyltransferase [Candidatus Limnocylindrales bacterium]|nr:peptide chain release factor N(5)-glutamine methyltransferase [Candidatus Limnocylindrales bacterium]
MPTVRELLDEGISRLRASGSESPRLDAELLLARAISADRTAVLAHPDAPVGDGQAASYAADVRRREDGEPVAYIRGFKEFYGIALGVDRRVLIPRPETERLVELAEDEVADRLTSAPRSPGGHPLRVVDVGTGSGAVAIALAVALRRRRMLEHVELIATDDSDDAIAVAQVNAVGHGVADRVRFVSTDLLTPVVERPYDLVAANLPYIPSADVEGLPIAASFEPRAALDGGPDGLALIRRLLARLPEALADSGVALLEIGSEQAAAIEAAVGASLPGWSIAIEADLSGRPRVARIWRAAVADRPGRPA